MASHWSIRRKASAAVDKIEKAIVEDSDRGTYQISSITGPAVRTVTGLIEVPAGIAASHNDLYVPDQITGIIPDAPTAGTDHFEVDQHASDSHSDSSDNNFDSSYDDMENDLSDELSHWAIKHQVTATAVTDLLGLLRSHFPHLPRDARSLLNTPRNLEIMNICGGSYYHFGLREGLLSVFESHSMPDHMDCVRMQVNIDGLPLFKSSGAQFWPILCMIELIPQPFIAGLYYGTQKPSSTDFSQPFVDEYLALMNNGMTFNGKRYSLVISCVVCDAPARAFVKSVIPHTGYFVCGRCFQEGEWG